MLTVRYFAAARAASGVTEERAEAATLAHLIAALSHERDEGLARILEVASFLVDGVIWRDQDAPLPREATVDVLPPFAGG